MKVFDLKGVLPGDYTLTPLDAKINIEYQEPQNKGWQPDEIADKWKGKRIRDMLD